MQDPGSNKDLQSGKQIYGGSAAREVIDQHLNEGKQLGAVLLSRTAVNSGALVDWINNVTCIATAADKRMLILGYIHNQTQVASRIVGDKFLTKKFLSARGVAVPEGSLAHSEVEAVEAWRRISQPVTLKPLGAYGGKGISTDLDDRGQIQEAYRVARAFGGPVLVEQHINAVAEYRALATPGECVSVVERILPYVTGDGRSSIMELIREKNKIRDLNPSHVGRPIPIDVVTERTLAKNGLSFSDVPAREQQITVREVGGLSSGGEANECLDDVPAIIRETGRQAVAAIPGLTWGGCDLLIDRMTGKPYVIEVNTTPGIAGSMFPAFGRPKDIAQFMWQRRVEEASLPPSGPPLVCKVKENPGTVKEALANVGLPEERTRLGAYGATYLTSNGVQTSETMGLLRMTATLKGEDRWFTRDLEGPGDLAVTTRVLKRYGTVRALLRAANVPRVLGRDVKSARELERFRRGRENVRLTLLPYRREWRSSETRRIGVQEAVTGDNLEGFRRWVVQLRQSGIRLRIIASLDAALCVLGQEDALRLSDRTIQEAGQLAVRAIRAVPELRWATVDILVRRGVNSGEPLRVLVEGLATSPRLWPAQIVLAGGLPDAVEAITELPSG